MSIDSPEQLVTFLALVAGWLIGCFLVRGYAEKKGLEGTPYFVASVFLSPAVGFIAAAAAQPKPK
jgi:hypothetical protein